MLTEADRVMLAVGQRESGGFHLLSQWYFGITPMPKQYAYHQARQPNVARPWVQSPSSSGHELAARGAMLQVEYKLEYVIMAEMEIELAGVAT